MDALETVGNAARNVRMKLKCAKCGHQSTYGVGTVIIDMTLGDGMDETVCFTGYFRCKKCNSAWPWELTQDAVIGITALTLGAVKGMSVGGAVFASPRMFDGTPVRSPAQGEDYLLSILEKEPHNHHVWGRLGNVFVHAGMMTKAKKAFEKAVEIEPDDIESIFSLGQIAFEKGWDKQAAELLQKTVRLAYKNTKVDDELLRDMVLSAVGTLGEIHESSGGKIDFMPPMPERTTKRADAIRTLRLESYDLSKEADQERLLDALIGRPRPKKSAGSAKVGRNEPCPCGSGRKYKRCCGG